MGGWKIGSYLLRPFISIIYRVISSGDSLAGGPAGSRLMGFQAKYR
jgi:hypothetical protein